VDRAALLNQQSLASESVYYLPATTLSQSTLTQSPNMCLVSLAYKAHSTYPLLVAANRDEYHQRPTAAAQFWKEYPDLLAGKDLQAGGTWMGVTRAGRFAAITNHRNPPTTPLEPRSRGFLTLDFLRGEASASQYLETVNTRAGEYAGFNLIVGDSEQLWYLSNIEGRVQKLQPGIYSLSNALLHSNWPKQALASTHMQRCAAGEAGHRALQAVVSSRVQVEEHRLPDTGVGLEFEKLLSAPFIVSPEYGTRATTSLSLDSVGRGDWLETSFDATGHSIGQQRWQFSPGERE
jgi:uncharacterized protein with NRDE domain